MPKVLLVSDARAVTEAAEAAFRDGAHDLRCEPTLERGLLAMRDDPARVFCVDLDVGLTMGGFAALMRDPQFEGTRPCSPSPRRCSSTSSAPACP